MNEYGKVYEATDACRHATKRRQPKGARLPNRPLEIIATHETASDYAQGCLYGMVTARRTLCATHRNDCEAHQIPARSLPPTSKVAGP